MPLCRKSPTLTPARLAALRANAQKSTGPRTRRGKARSALNGFRHGRYSRRLPQLLARAGDVWGERQYAWIRGQIRKAFRRSGRLTFADGRRIDWMAAQVWCSARRASQGANLEPSPQMPPGRIWFPPRLLCRVHDARRGVCVVFWTQRRKVQTRRGFLRMLQGEPWQLPRRIKMEQACRAYAYRTMTEREWEQMQQNSQAMDCLWRRRERQMAEALAAGESPQAFEARCPPSPAMQAVLRQFVELWRLMRAPLASLVRGDAVLPGVGRIGPLEPWRPETAAQREARRIRRVELRNRLAKALESMPELKEERAMMQAELEAAVKAMTPPQQPGAPFKRIEARGRDEAPGAAVASGAAAAPAAVPAASSAAPPQPQGLWTRVRGFFSARSVSRLSAQQNAQEGR